MTERGNVMPRASHATTFSKILSHFAEAPHCVHQVLGCLDAINAFRKLASLCGYNIHHRKTYIQRKNV